MGLKNRLFRYYIPEFVAARKIRRFPASSGIVLMYHNVLPDDVTLPAWTIVREADFRWQMSYLQTHFDVVTMDQALERVAGKIESSKAFAVVTFDDGYKGNLDTALPVMESIGLPFILYVATQAIIDGSLYWYDQIISLLNAPADVQVSLTGGEKVEYFRIPRHAGDNRRWLVVQRLLTRLKQMNQVEREEIVKHIMDNNGGAGGELKMLTPECLQRLACSDCVTVGSHTHRHDLLDQLDAQGIRETLQVADDHITRITGCRPKHFAYPNGNFNQWVLDQVREAGYETAVTTIPGTWSSQDHRMEIPRISIGRFDTRSRFKAKVSGFL